jgi:hypothetical protein
MAASDSTLGIRTLNAIRTTLLVSIAIALALPVAASAATSERGVDPRSYNGNFIASDDDQVCYDMAAMGFIVDATSEMRGIKIDPPTGYGDAYIIATISEDGRSLSWESSNATVLAFIIKGGPKYHVYDYVNRGFDWDGSLVSPLNKRSLPAISHYNLCYSIDVTGDEGCTPGYWRNHADRWAGVAPSDDFDSIFGVDLFTPNVSLGWAIWASGGGANALARHATAALLNANGGVPNSDGNAVDYPYSVSEVIAMVQQAAAPDGSIDAVKDVLAAANELGCPLSGTKAKPVQ